MTYALRETTLCLEMSIRRRDLALLVSLVLAAVSGISGQSAPEALPARKVLVVYSYAKGLPWNDALSAGIAAALSEYPENQRPECFEEYLDSARLGDSALNDTQAAALALKYRSIKFDAVFTDSQQAALLLLRNPALFAGAPRYLFNFVPHTGLPKGSGGERMYATDLDVGESLKALAVFRPGLKRIVAVLDKSVLGKAYAEQLGTRTWPFAVEIWDEFTVDELRAKAAKLPEDSAIFYLPVQQDRLGRPLRSFKVASSLAAAASVPVFSQYDTLLGSGIVGGYLQSANQLGRLIGRVAGFGESALPASQAAYAEALRGYYFDARALKRWRIDEGRLPKNSHIVFRDSTLWSRYGIQLAAIALVFILETLLVLSLVRLRVQNRRSIALLAAERGNLETKVAARTAELDRINATLASTLREKETLLKELQHRVKNSMALMTGLIALEGTRSASDECKSILENLEARVNALSLLYDLLYRGSAGMEVRMDLYFGSILDSIVEGHGGDARGIAIERDVEPVILDAKRVIALGLCVTELVTDSLKHAFPGGRGGTIRVSLKREGGDLALRVVDDGVGLGEDFAPGSQKGLGMTLVDSLAGELGGRLEYASGRGARFTITFPFQG